MIRCQDCVHGLEVSCCDGMDFPTLCMLLGGCNYYRKKEASQ